MVPGYCKFYCALIKKKLRILFSPDAITPSQVGSVVQGIMQSFITFRSGTKKSMSTNKKWKAIWKNTIEEGKQEGFPDGKEKRECGGCWGSGWGSYGLVLPCTNFFIFFNLFFCFYFTILHWFFHTLTWIHHGCTCVPHPETPSHLPPHPIPLGHPGAPAPSTLYHASNLDWWFISYMIIYMFQCHSPISSHPRPLPQSPKDCSIHLCLFCCLAYRAIATVFLNSIYMR